MNALHDRFQKHASYVHAVAVDTRKRRKFDYMSTREVELTRFVSEMSNSDNSSRGVRLDFCERKWINDEYETFVRNLFRLVRANFATDYFLVECSDDGPAADYLLVLAAVINEARPLTPCLEFENTPSHVIAAFLDCLDDKWCPFAHIDITNKFEMSLPAATHLFDAIEKKALHSTLKTVDTNDARAIWENIPVDAESALTKIHIFPEGDDYEVLMLVSRMARNSVTVRRFDMGSQYKSLDDRIRRLEELRREKKRESPAFEDEFDTTKKISALVTEIADLTERRRRAHAANPLLLLVCAHALAPDSLVAVLPFDVLVLVLNAARLT